MSDNSLYTTTDGRDVPDAVGNAFAAPNSDAWYNIQTSEPGSIRVGYQYGNALYDGVRPDGTKVLVSEDGEVTPRHHYEYVTQVGDGYAACTDTPFTYHSGINYVHPDHRSEHITTVTVVFGEGERFRLCSRSGVIYHSHDPATVRPRSAPEEVRRMALALSDTKAPLAHDPEESAEVPDIPDDVSRWSSGSHRTDRPTKTSERWNAVVTGDLPPSWDTDSIVAFKNSDTRNVLHRELVAHANETGRAALDSVFSEDEGSVTFP